jgi:hypothetical protein
MRRRSRYIVEALRGSIDCVEYASEVPCWTLAACVEYENRSAAPWQLDDRRAEPRKSQTMLATDAIESAVERLYSVFASYSANLADRSPHAGITEADAAKLQSRPLRELAVSDLDRYMRSALTTWGGVSEFKHFLPRIFELVVRRPTAIDPLVFEKLDAAEWRSWPREEQDAVEIYLAALWRWALALSPDVVNAGDLLRGIGLSGHDLAPWLDVWRRDRSPTATDQLALFVVDMDNDLQLGHLPSYWHPKDHATMLSFLSEPATRSRVEEAFLERSDGEPGRRLARASDILARLSQ